MAKVRLRLVTPTTENRTVLPRRRRVAEPGDLAKQVERLIEGPTSGIIAQGLQNSRFRLRRLCVYHALPTLGTGQSTRWRAVGLGLALPFPPVRRVHINPLLGRRVNHLTGNATDRKRERVRVCQYHSKFKVAIERRSTCGLPAQKNCELFAVGR